MPEEAGLDIDYDAELARIQGSVTGVSPPPPEQPRAELEAVPVSGEVIDDHRAVEFMGDRFRIADKIGLMPLLKFSAFADVSTSDPRALGAMYAMLRDCIYPGEPGCGECKDCQAGNDELCASYLPGDWLRFEEHAMLTRADADDLLDLISRVMEMISGRPTGQSGNSSPGQPGTSGASTGRSSARRGRGSRR